MSSRDVTWEYLEACRVWMKRRSPGEGVINDILFPP